MLYNSRTAIASSEAAQEQELRCRRGFCLCGNHHLFLHERDMADHDRGSLHDRFHGSGLAVSK